MLCMAYHTLNDFTFRLVVQSCKEHDFFVCKTSVSLIDVSVSEDDRLYFVICIRNQCSQLDNDLVQDRI